MKAKTQVSVLPSCPHPGTPGCPAPQNTGSQEARLSNSSRLLRSLGAQAQPPSLFHNQRLSLGLRSIDLGAELLRLSELHEGRGLGVCQSLPYPSALEGSTKACGRCHREVTPTPQTSPSGGPKRMTQPCPKRSVSASAPPPKSDPYVGSNGFEGWKRRAWLYVNTRSVLWTLGLIKAQGDAAPTRGEPCLAPADKVALGLRMSLLPHSPSPQEPGFFPLCLGGCGSRRPINTSPSPSWEDHPARARNKQTETLLPLTVAQVSFLHLGL